MSFMWKNMIKHGRPQLTLCRMRIACWIPKVTNTHSEYVIIIAFALQQWLHESASLLCYTYIVVLFFTIRATSLLLRDSAAAFP
jgi:hypothetical protein